MFQPRCTPDRCILHRSVACRVNQGGLSFAANVSTLLVQSRKCNARAITTYAKEKDKHNEDNNKDVAKLAKRLEDAEMQARELLQRLQNAAPQPSSQHSSSAVDVSAAWQQQQELWQREMQRWAEERKMWDAREAALHAHIQQLQQQLVDLAIQTATLHSVPPTTGITATVTAPQHAATAAPQSGATAQHASSSAPAAQLSTAAALRTATAPSSSSSGQAKSAAGTADSAAAAVFAALAAVDKYDVLSDIDAVLSGQQVAAPNSMVPQSTAPQSTVPQSTVPQSTVPRPAAQPAASSLQIAQLSESVSSLAGAEQPQAGASPEGPPPVLSVGDDDIYWVNQLQAALLKKGYYPGEEEMEDWTFGGGTQAALMTFQACEGLPETGVADDDDWRALLGDTLQRVTRADMTGIAADAADAANGSADGVAEKTAAAGGGGSAPFASLFASAVGRHDDAATATSPSAAMAGKQMQPASAGTNSKLKWPILMELDGGRAVHELQKALERKGYCCTEDDTEWWHFGTSTAEALRTFQACEKLPQSGVTDEATWRALLGSDAHAEDLDAGSDHDDDLGDNSGRVWLLAEGRWENKSRLPQ